MGVAGLVSRLFGSFVGAWGWLGDHGRGLASAIKNKPVKAAARRGRPSAGAGGVEKVRGSLVKKIPGNGRFVSPGKPGKQGRQ